MSAAWPKSERGVSLTEIIIALVILTVALVGLLGAITTSIGIYNRNTNRMILSNLAKAKVEEIASYMSGSHTLADLFGKYNGETQTSNILLADGVTPLPGNYLNFSRAVSVSYVDILSDIPGGLLSQNNRLEPTGMTTNNVMVAVTASHPNFGSVKLIIFFFA